MKFCTACGTKLRQGHTFCTHCGKQIEMKKRLDREETETARHLETVASSPIEEQLKETNVRRKKEVKKMRWLLSSMLLLFALLFGSYKYAQYYYDPLHELEALDEAITRSDLDTFLQFVSFQSADALLDEEAFFEYIRAEEWNTTIKKQYRDIIKNGRPFPDHVDLFSVGGSVLFTLQKESVFLSLFDSFKLVAIPQTVTFQVDVDELELTFRDETYTITEEDGIFSLLIYPGDYDVIVTAKNEYGSFRSEEILSIQAIEEDSYNVNLPMKHVYVDAQTGFETATVYIDDETTENTVLDIEQIGPFPEDSSMKVHAVWTDDDGEQIVSNVVYTDEIENSDTVYFTFDTRYKLQTDQLDNEAVGQFILHFRDAYERAVNDANYAEIKPFLKEKGAAEKELQKFVKDMGDGNYYYDFLENNVLSVKEIDETTFEVTTNETFEFIDDDSTHYFYDREKIYIVEKADNGYGIVKIEYVDTKKKRL